MSGLRVAPAAWLRGDDAIEALAGHLAARAAVVLLVHGRVGYPVVRDRLDAALAAAGVRAARAAHEGPCTARAIDALAAAAAREGARAVLGVGGGRVLDAGKGAALAAGLPFAALPTSPATCAATAATVVRYDERGAHVDVLEGGPVAAACALDPGLLASAPDRLLAAGVVDAWAKVHEVRLTSARAGGNGAAGARAVTSATTRAALALVDDLAELLRAHASGALAAGPGGERDEGLLPRRRLVAEAVVAYPGLIGGLAGADAKLALAHPLHDALTHLPGAHAALHGELVGFGTLVQLRVAGREVRADDASRCTAAERVAAFRAEAVRYAELGVRCHLEALGCGDARSAPVEEAVVRRALADPSVASALPSLGFDELLAAVREVDAWVRAA
ncbi:MAG: iron-containing alcohol dehydrogenase [Trueperaceae bacterium]